MADLDIAAMDAAQKLEFAQAVGSISLAKGSILAPTPAVILSLPAGYSCFILRTQGMNASAGSQITFAVGDEGIEGEFYKDDVDFTGYDVTYHAINKGISDTAPSLSFFEDGYGYIQDIGGMSGITVMDIYPGSASEPFHSHSRFSYWTGGLIDPESPVSATNKNVIAEYATTYNKEAVRMNAFRLCGVGAANLTTGNYALIGVA
jgi:hypothetical protein